MEAKLEAVKTAVIREPLVKLTGNYLLALVLNQFIYWTWRVRDADELLKEEIARINRKQRHCILFFAGGAFETPWYMRGLDRFLMDLIKCGLPEHGFEFANPLSADRRGGHVALVHEAGAKISKAWRAASVVTDFRAPDIIRLAPSPLYTSFHDCYESISRLRLIMKDRTFQRFSDEPGVVP